jgi:hypothetical protein
MYINSPLEIDAKQFRENASLHWSSTAVYWYQLWYSTMNEYTREERMHLESLREVLNGTIPTELRDGVHLLAPDAADMGEDIYVVDGDVTHTLHMQHKLCEKYSVLGRNVPNHEVRMDRPTHGLWCAECKAWANRIDCA